MTVKAIRLQNFMAFEDTGWIELRPITLLFGRNSSGKSVIIRALRLLKQSLMNPPEIGPFVYAMEDGVDVGSFPEMIHQYDTKRVLSFGFQCQIPPILLSYLVGVERQYTPIPEQESWSNFILSLGWDDRSQEVELLSIEIEASWSAHPEHNKRTIFGAERVKSQYSDEDEWYFWSDFLQEYESDTSDNIWPATRIGLRKGFLPWLDVQSVMEWSEGYPEEAWGGDFNFIFRMLREFEASVKQFLIGLAYTPPIRPEPQRFYMLKKAEQRRWQQRGMEEYLRFILDETTKVEKQRTEGALFDINLGEHIEVNVKYRRPDGRGKITEIFMDEIGENGIYVNLIDLGFGVSQVLPVLVQSVLASINSVVVIEQPELHLHPAAQAELGDMFIKLALAEDGPRFFLETHSETLILRMMRRMKNTARNELSKNIPSTTPENIGVYVTNRNRGESFSTIHRMEISPEGKLLEPWPGGFFEEGFRERFAKEDRRG